jgi:hypothetical protein
MTVGTEKDIVDAFKAYQAAAEDLVRAREELRAACSEETRARNLEMSCANTLRQAKANLDALLGLDGVTS